MKIEQLTCAVGAELLDVNLGDAGNVVQIMSTQAGTVTTLRTGAGADSVTACSTLSDASSTVNDLSGALVLDVQAEALGAQGLGLFRVNVDRQ